MAFAGEYSGWDPIGDIKKAFSSVERHVRKELKRVEQKARPVTKALLPVAGAVVGTILLPGLGTVLAGSIGGAVVSAGQAVYETEGAKKEARDVEAQMAAETAAYQQMAQEPYGGQVQQKIAKAGLFSKPSNLLLATGLTIGLIAYVPPLKKRRRRRR